MRKAVAALGLALSLAACGSLSSAPAPSSAPATQPDLVAGEAIVLFKDGVSLQSLSGDLAGLSLSSVRTLSGGETLLRLAPAGISAQSTLGAQATLEAVSALARSGKVVYAQPNYRVHVPGGERAGESLSSLAVPNDTYYAQYQWDLPKMNLPAAWDITKGSASTVIAVLDTGITAHPDLLGRTVAGYDFISDPAVAVDGGGRDSDPTDPGDQGDCGTGFQSSSFHGSHVTGTIAAASNNARGIAGINWLGKVQPLRVLGKCGGSTADIIDAIRWAGGLAVAGVPANATPAKVINMSLGGTLSAGQTCSRDDVATQRAISDVIARGVTVVVAAGNEATNASTSTPASCDGVITVAATTKTDRLAPYSNYGATVEISAPGGDTSAGSSGGILSTLKDDTGAYFYGFYQGTSMATPHVAGVVSLMYGLKPTLTPAQVVSALQSTARAFPAGSSCANSATLCGKGIVDALKALQKVQTL